MADYRICRADVSHVKTLHSMMYRIYDLLPDKTLFALDGEGEDYIKSHLEEQGFCLIALSDQGELAGFLFVDYPGQEPHNLGYDLGFDEEQRERTVHMEMCMVEPAHRGHGLEYRFLLEAERELPERFRYLCATAAPHNPASLKSLEKAGYRVMLTKEKYGGFLRHLLLKERLPVDKSSCL